MDQKKSSASKVPESFGWKRKPKRGSDNGFGDWGGYMAAKQSKLTKQFQGESSLQKESDLFRGVSIFVNGYTNPSADQLKRLMMLHSGDYHHYYSRSKTTHIIATNLPDSKIKALQPDQKVVHPNWITESISGGRLLDYRAYLLYTSSSAQGNNQRKLSWNDRSGVRLSSAVVAGKENRGGQLLPLSVSESEGATDSGPDVIPDSDSMSVWCSYCLLQEEAEKASPDPPSHPGDDKPPETLPEDPEHSTGERGEAREPSASKFPEADAVPTPSVSSTTAGATSGILLSTNTIVSSHIEPSSISPPASTASCVATNPNFLSDFYAKSRLHHLSTMGATFKEYVRKLISTHAAASGFAGRDRLKQWLLDHREGMPHQPTTTSTVVMHIDMDCFFVSVGLRRRPDLRGKPVAVTHSRSSQSDSSTASSRDPLLSTSEVSSCSYEARKMGVKNGMYVGQAMGLCPDLQCIPYDFEGYKNVSYQLYDILASYSLDLEAVSCDEMFVNLTDVLVDTGATPLEAAACIRHEIQSSSDCPCSAGLGSSRLLARLATKKAKPNGQWWLRDQEREAFLSDLPVRDLPGVGYSTAAQLKEQGVLNCADLRAIALSKLQHDFGPKTGQTLYDFARGVDSREPPSASASLSRERKSISVDVNYGIRFKDGDKAAVRKFLDQLVSELVTRMKEHQVATGLLALKILVRAEGQPKEPHKYMGCGICDSVSRSVGFPDPTQDEGAMARCVWNAFQSMSLKESDLRGLGIQATRLTSLEKKLGGKRQATLNAFIRTKSQEILSKQKPALSAGSPPKFPRTASADSLPSPVQVVAKGDLKKRTSATSDFDVSFSQIDPSVLSALPDDIVSELKAESVKRRVTAEKQKQWGSLLAPTTSSSSSRGSKSATFTRKRTTPTKKQSPRKFGVSPVKRGSPKASMVSPSKRPSRDTCLQSTSKSRQSLFPVEKQSSVIQQEEGKSSESEMNQRSVQQTPYREPSLAGETSLAGVSKLISEWISSGLSPEASDVEDVASYLSALIRRKEIEKVFPLARKIRRLCKKSSSAWEAASEDIIRCLDDELLIASTSVLMASSSSSEVSSITDQIVNVCRSFPDGISDQSLRDALPSVTIQDRVNGVNSLLRAGKVVLLRGKPTTACPDGELLYRLAADTVTAAAKSSPRARASAAPATPADVEEKVILQLISESGRKGIWIRELRDQSHLPVTQVNKFLKSLLGKKLIKVVKAGAAASARRNVYMLMDLEPDPSLISGSCVWISDDAQGGFEAEFVEILSAQCLKFIEQRATEAEQKCTDPLAIHNSSLVTSKEVQEFVAALGISKISISVEEIEMLLDAIVLDQTIEMVIVGSEKCYRRVHLPFPEPGLSKVPCGVCPLVNSCSNVGSVTPKSCDYMNQWVDNFLRMQF
ncbi:unnamed protein product [Cyprideis torosa]|uniref:DNA repair protein REV1 n=1 Tax=Cyprideis torosa TaxID=163714 RepID=A0A7R8W6H6_9CRUS|nr:unnamed protein product [Cyprideis torosa]CAG0881056.1 unnamed protein product [Cyprideis torosa]